MELKTRDLTAIEERVLRERERERARERESEREKS
jgi:hypothetical protein